MLSDDDFERLRYLVDSTPEGSLPRILFTELDEMRTAEKEREAEANRVTHEKMIALLVSDGHSEGDAEKIFSAIVNKQKVEDEEVPCPKCRGWKTIESPGCVGGYYEKCRKCFGRGMVTRLKVPA